jgi:hypothetical protein
MGQEIDISSVVIRNKVPDQDVGPSAAYDGDVALF